MLDVSSVWFGVGGVGAQPFYHEKRGQSIVGSHGDHANLVPCSVELLRSQLATRSHSLIGVLSADFARPYINIAVG